MKLKRYCITDTDRCRLGALLTSCEARAWGRARSVSALNARLEDADAIDSKSTPTSLVTMNSTVELLDVRSGRRCVTLAYPADCELVPDSVSVFEPLGTELLGSHIGDIFSFGNQQYRVNAILYQPESAGAWHL
jgi:transcription elongation GreA/GreB family factor